ncbi:PD-(D/E)XK motif protein [[Mycobacterium] nativiensis]|uniref:PD-(D/E)XK motif protein n=1 Tax=[Mycobacterium] nativiensis TaxID=2855503 RepID=A0ABU5XVY3_9MYCO|nr:PD-(D/E)XK motif protein [Mycolicibacter sp. MYC340]MEB3032083.1 PD-(D/E)XK motif protein [Mycolicibacter sp. MYC340]
MTDVTDELLERAWSVLSLPRGGELASFPLDIAFAGVPCRVARDNDRVRHFLVPCVEESPPIDARPAILTSTVRPLAFGSGSATYLDVSCSDASLHPEFNEVISDVLEVIEHSSRPATDATAVIARWRRLFRSRLVRGLSPEAKRGLFAELTVLSALIDADPGFPVERWRGPLREPHDFETPVRCIEVKALAEDSDTFVVHGWEQLAEHGGRTLDLALVTVLPDPDGATLAELVTALRARIDSKGTFASRLLAVGWDQESAADDQDRFSIGAVFVVHVDDAVPRLVPDRLVGGQAPIGVSALRYEVDIAFVVPLAYGTSLAVAARGRE